MINLTTDTKNMSEEEILRVENEYWVGMYEALERLNENADFKTVILEGYFRDKAVNGVSMLANDHVIRNGLRTQVMENLIAISQLQDYFIMIENLGAAPRDDSEDEE